MGENKTWTQYQNAQSYQRSMGFATDFPRFVAFKEGSQWSAATEKTRHLPRPVFNIIDMFVRTKRAAVLSQPITINYTAAELPAAPESAELAADGARDFTTYAKQLWKRLGQKRLCAELVDDAATLGTGILHYYHDLSVSGGSDSPWRGEIRGETIDPLNFFVSNPQCRDIQRQDWVIIAQRVTVDSARRLAELHNTPQSETELITGDSQRGFEGYTAAQHEVSGEDKLTLLTKYHRAEDGSVVYTRCTEQVVICDSVRLTPPGASPVTLYPLAVFSWYIRKKCIFGIGEVQTLIPAQKAINFLKAMELLSVQQTAWPKLLVKPNALQGQAITNEPGEVLTDYYQNGAGINYLNPPALSGAGSALADNIMSLLRTTSGVNEATTGESMGASMAASAIIALQNQARTPIEEIQDRFWQCIEEVGAIWAQLIKAYYTDERIIGTDPSEAGASPTRRIFRGASYAGVDFDMTVDVGAASEYGEMLEMSTLDMMLQRGDITIDQYVELAPANVVPFKEQFKRMREQSGQAAEALQQQAQMMLQQAQVGAPIPGGETPAPTDSPPNMIRPAGAAGVTLPAIPKA